MLQDPLAYEFEPEDIQKGAGDIWMDHLHPTSKTHAIIGREVGEFLQTHSATFIETSLQAEKPRVWSGFGFQFIDNCVSKIYRR